MSEGRRTKLLGWIQNWRGGIVGALLVIGFCVWVLLGSRTFQNCIQQSRSDSQYDPLYEDITGFPVSFGRLLPCLGLFFEENGEAITALFTAVLAISTIGLWLQTARLARQAERQIETERRPWIDVTPRADSDLRFSSDEADVTLAFVARNSGLTPATSVWCRVVAIPSGTATKDAWTNFLDENRTEQWLAHGVLVFPNKDTELPRYSLRMKISDFDSPMGGRIAFAPSVMCAAIYKTTVDEKVHQTAFVGDISTMNKMIAIGGPPIPKEGIEIRNRGLMAYAD